MLVFEHACFHSLFGYIFAYQDVSQYTQNEQKSMLYFEQLTGVKSLQAVAQTFI